MSSNRDDTAPADGADAGDHDTTTASELRATLSRRRTLLGGALVGAGLVGAAALLGGDGGGSDDGSDPAGGVDEPPARETTPVEESEARRLAERFAPTLYFGRREKWFPTDPRPYTSDVDGEIVVDGFDALDGYTAAQADSDGVAPESTVFYRVQAYTERLAVVQYWLYSAFDQFSVNFHWHDWELLQAFVDRESDDAVLYVASAHSRSVPNNEYLDPETTPAIISEVGSHSSALGMNERRDTFQRVAIDGLVPDVTNGVLSVASGEEGVPLAYGLPRDEGFRLPYVVPELDGAPLTDHPKLPNVSADDLVDADLTVESLTDLARPPTALPERERGPVFEPDHRTSADADERYGLVPATAIEEITAFTGPQLSFEFFVPEFLEDAVASHITTTPPPWDQPRYRDPLADVTDDVHRETIAERFGVDVGKVGSTVVGRIRELQPVEDATAGVTLTAPSVEAVTRLASDPVAVPTFGGVAAFLDVEPGEHTLTVNGPGYAPYAQQVSVGETDSGSESETTTETDTTATATETRSSPSATDGAVRVGSNGQVGLVPNEDAVKLEIDASDRGGARRVRIDDDVAGRLFDATPVQTDGRAGVYVHRAGGYTVEVTDSRGEQSVERVNPGPNQAAAEVAKARTGVAGVTRFLVDFLSETRETVVRQLRTRGGGDDSRTGGGETTDHSTDQSTDSTENDSTETATTTVTSTATPTAPETTTTATSTQPRSDRDRLRTLLDDAVATAETANEAAVAGDDQATADALRELRTVLESLSSLADRETVPQAARRVLGRRIETADDRAARALSQLEA